MPSKTSPVVKVYRLVMIDSSDSLRPPGFDLMILLIATLGAVLASIQPIVEAHVAVRIILDPTLFATAIFLALRSSAGITSLVQSGGINTYMSYPLSRLGVAVGLFLSRVLIPAASLLLVPLIVAGVILWPTISRGLDNYALMYVAYLIQALLYGSMFTVIAVVSRSPGTASVASIAVYFTYNVLSLIFSVLGSSMGVSLLVDIGDAMGFNYMVYRSLLGEHVLLWQLAMVPILTTILIASILTYFTRRFEPV